MTIIDEAPSRNGSVVHSQPTANSRAVSSSTGSPAETPAALTAEGGPSSSGRRRRRAESATWTRLRSAMSGNPRLESDSAMAEADAAAKRAERFFSGWLVVATAISIVANVAHAWLTAPADVRLGAALASLVPPVVLLVQTHALFMLIKARRFGWAFAISLLVTVLIGAGAFLLSFESIRVLVIALGTSPDHAGLFPAIIDLSIVGCTVALYALTRPRPAGKSEPDAEPQVGGGAVADLPLSSTDLRSLSLTERVMMWDRAASVVKERNPDVRAIAERSTGEIAEVLRLTHEEGKNQREIVEVIGLNDRIVRAIKRAGLEVLRRTDPGALQLD